MSSSDDMISPQRMQEVGDLCSRAKALAKNGKLQESLEHFQRAYDLYPTKKIQERINKVKEYMKDIGGSEDDDTSVVKIGKNGLQLCKTLADKMYPYQREGLDWLYGLHKQNKGGVLGDDMGLGKTVQIIGLLSGLFDAEKIKTALVVMPVSLMTNWTREFDKWAPGINVYEYHSLGTSARDKLLQRVQKRGGVLLTTYGLVFANFESLSVCNTREFVWDYVILDEGHKIKNPTKTTKAVHAIPARHRLVLTGTPIQNNLRELWSLYDWCHNGRLLGSYKTFKTEFENPITKGREKDATLGQKRLGTQINEQLQKLYFPYFLRRTKMQVLNNKENCGPNGPQALQHKNDFVVWLFMSDVQEKIYREFLASDEVKFALMNEKKSPLVQLTVLKKIADHPRLLNQKACKSLGLDHDNPNADVLDDQLEATAMSIDHLSDDELIAESGKMGVLLELMENLRQGKHRTLIFSRSKRILNMLDRILKNRRIYFCRIDGDISKPSERQDIIDRFDRDKSIPYFLLTTQVGGVGLNIVSADRVIIFDPSWNPATDSQAVDRAYRIGQKKSVVVYRFITCGTVEEKIYRRQVFKDSITRQATGDSKVPFRYFSHMELRELFVLDDPKTSRTQLQLIAMHGSQRKTTEELDKHLEFLHTLEIFGIHDHDLMFNADDVDASMGKIEQDFISKKAMEASNRLVYEAQLMSVENEGKFSRKESDVPVVPRAALADVGKNMLNAINPLNYLPNLNLFGNRDAIDVDEDDEREHSDEHSDELQKSFAEIDIKKKISPAQKVTVIDDDDDENENPQGATGGRRFNYNNGDRKPAM